MEQKIIEAIGEGLYETLSAEFSKLKVTYYKCRLVLEYNLTDIVTIDSIENMLHCITYKTFSNNRNRPNAYFLNKKVKVFDLVDPDSLAKLIIYIKQSLISLKIAPSKSSQTL